MKKKIILLLTLISVIFSIPTPLSQAIPFPITDTVDDVKIYVADNSTGVPTYYPPCDIYRITTNTSYLLYTFIGKPIIDNEHQYNVTIFWDISHENYTMCIAGNLVGNAYDMSDTLIPFSNGTFSCFRNNIGEMMYSEIDSDTVEEEACDGMSFQVSFTLFPLISYSNPYAVFANAKVPESIAVYPQLDIGPGNDLQTTFNGGWVCDSAGSGFCWIPLPGNGGIELPIILTLLGSSFIIILVIRRRKK